MSSPATSDTELIGYLLAGAAYNDSLLQAYRTLLLTIGPVLVAVGAGLCVAVLTIDDIAAAALIAVMLALLGTLNVYVLLRMRPVIESRGEDVYFWHRALIRAEENLPANLRHFTDFKFDQARRGQRGRQSKAPTEHLKQPPTGLDIEALVSSSPGHVRRTLDSVTLTGISAVWVALVAASTGWVVCRCIGVV